MNFCSIFKGFLCFFVLILYLYFFILYLYFICSGILLYIRIKFSKVFVCSLSLSVHYLNFTTFYLIMNQGSERKFYFLLRKFFLENFNEKNRDEILSILSKCEKCLKMSNLKILIKFCEYLLIA